MKLSRAFIVVLILVSVLTSLLAFSAQLFTYGAQSTDSFREPIERVIVNQKLGTLWPGNIIRHSIIYAVSSGVSPETIILLLLLPLVALFIAGSRNVIGLRGFGILLPAALAVSFVSTGPVVGIGLFLMIVAVSTLTRMFLKDAKIRLQYLPRMAFILWAVALSILGLLFIAPLFNRSDFANVSIFPVLILILLSEDFTRVQIGKNIKAAINITAETLLLAYLSFLILTFQPIRVFAILNPEILLLSVAIFDFIIGKYSGLRFIEFYRFRKLIKS